MALSKNSNTNGMDHMEKNNSNEDISLEGEEMNLNNIDFRKPGKSLIGKCRICKDKSSGLHYGAYTCEGCKVIL